MFYSSCKQAYEERRRFFLNLRFDLDLCRRMNGQMDGRMLVVGQSNGKHSPVIYYTNLTSLLVFYLLDQNPEIPLTPVQYFVKQYQGF
ncbi:hypothetical protein M0804_012669 [Polistes exclamans]|nr:hypothetical protein M0804_012669 [Polistes exclamans]